MDEHVNNANAIKIILQKDSFNVIIFNDPFFDIKVLYKKFKKFAVVLSHVRIPCVNGIELMAKIKDFARG